MKPRTVPVKRLPVGKKGGMSRLSAVTKKRRKQRASAATAADFEDDGSSKIARALTIIFLIHIVAIGLIFIHQRFLEGRPGEESGAVVTKTEIPDHPGVPAPRVRIENAPVLSNGDRPYIVKAGDNYAKIAEAMGVDEVELRQLNGNVEIQSGLILKLPAKRIVAAEPKEVVEIREREPNEQDRGLVEAVPVNVGNAPRAKVVRPAGGTVSGTTYVVKAGDSVWRLANRFNVSQDELMRINGIRDPRKMKVGMKLVIPR